MKLIGNLKKEVEQAESKAEAKEAILKAGMELTDDEVDQVAGGFQWRDLTSKDWWDDPQGWKDGFKDVAEMAKDNIEKAADAVKDAFYTH